MSNVCGAEFVGTSAATGINLGSDRVNPLAVDIERSQQIDCVGIEDLAASD